MKMTRHFFISDDLNDLERIEEDLERVGIVTPQIHLLTLDDSSASNHHHLHAVVSIMKTDIVHSTILGAIAGLCVAILAFITMHMLGWTVATPAGWAPFIFLSIVILGFFTWEGGLWGVESPNVHFRRFETALENGRHVFFVDLKPGQRDILGEVMKKHPAIEAIATTVRGAPRWLVFSQHRVKRFFVETFP
jgi:hypothetical protein